VLRFRDNEDINTMVEKEDNQTLTIDEKTIR
jgi:hypothetical protein